MAAARLAAGTGARLLGETFPARLERGAGLPPLDRLAYPPEFAAAQLAGTRHLILAGAAAPVSFFAYPDLPGSLVPPGCQVHVLARPGDDAPAALEALAGLAAAQSRPRLQPPQRPELPDGDLTAENAAAVIGALLPEGAIVSDEANTSGLWLPGATAGAPPHDWLTLTGGAIGQGLPLATGAAIACPDRPVLALESDGSAMYTISALWTQAREQLNVTTVIFSNRCYAILGMELRRAMAAAPGAAGQPGRPGPGRRPSPGPVPRPWACWTCPGPTSTSPRWRPAWASRPPGPGPRKNSPLPCAPPWPSPAPTSSRPRSPRSPDTAWWAGVSLRSADRGPQRHESLLPSLTAEHIRPGRQRYVRRDPRCLRPAAARARRYRGPVRPVDGVRGGRSHDDPALASGRGRPGDPGPERPGRPRRAARA